MAGSNTDSYAYRWVDDPLILNISVLPRASKNAVVGIHNQLIKVRLTAPPVEGKANQMLIKQLGRWFKVPTSRISIVQGESAKRKIVHIKQPVFLPEFIKTP